jgi:Ser/Thr protein kinase RdoA (MazF antagonist)
MDPAAVDAVLRHYPAPFRSRGFCLPPDGPGFSGAIVLRVETDAGPHCLRGWAADADAERINGLHHLLQHVRSRGIEFVAVPVPSKDGRTLVFVSGRCWQLEPWMAGRADFSSQPSGARLTAAVTSLARLHVAMAQFEAVGAERKWFGSAVNAIAPAVPERLERLESWTPEKLISLWSRLERFPDSFRLRPVHEDDAGFSATAGSIIGGFSRCATAVADELRAALRLRVPVQPCLRDVWHDHVLFVDDTVCGIIDPAAARTDTVAADLSRLLGSLIADDARAWETALAAYQTVRRLSPEELALVGVLDRSGTLLSGMTWLARRFFANVQFEQPERVIARMESIAKRLEVLARSIR